MGSYDLIRYLLRLIAELSGCLQKEHTEHKEVVTDLDCLREDNLRQKKDNDQRTAENIGQELNHPIGAANCTAASHNIWPEGAAET